MHSGKIVSNPTTKNPALLVRSKVLVRPDEKVTILIQPEELSHQPQAIIDKWQNILNSLRLVANVPSALIMRVTESEIEVHAASNNRENVYTVGARESLGIGLYCEYVMGKDHPFHVPDASASQTWKDNPDVALGMVAYYGIPVKWKDGKIFGTLCILDEKANEFSETTKDLMEILRDSIEADLSMQQMMSELHSAKEKAERANQVKSEFLSVMSHELRTPLSPIVGLCDLVRNRSEDPQIHQFVDMMHISAKQLLALIDDLFDMGSLEQKQLKVLKREFSMHQLIQETLAVFHTKIESSGLELIPPIAFEDYEIYSDPVRVKQILTNLIQNAIKFTEQGRIEVSCSLMDGKIAISVKDTGIGIEPENQERIFSSFTQVDSSFSRSYGGMGLGLSLCKELAVLLGGEITMESALGEGSCFTLLLPHENRPPLND